METDEDFFEVGGQRVFTIYAPNGSLAAMQISWLCKREGDHWFAAPLAFTLTELEYINLETLKERIAQAKQHYTEFDPNGGHLPLPAKAAN